MLKGLRPKGNAGAYGFVMSNAAQSRMGGQQQNQQMGLKQMGNEVPDAAAGCVTECVCYGEQDG